MIRRISVRDGGLNLRHLAAALARRVLLLVATPIWVAGCAGAPAPAPIAEDQPQHLPTATIRVGDVALVVEVAARPAEQQKGMMFRKKLSPDEAMLFVFPRDSNLSFWMKNTAFDLDLAYIGPDGRITQVERMKAYDLEPVFSREPARFALETAAGWLAAHGAKVGTPVAIPPEVAAAGRE